MPLDNSTDSEEYNIIHNIPTPTAFTYLEDNIVELMGGPVFTPLNTAYDDTSLDPAYDDGCKSVLLNEALNEYEFEKNGKELIFSINKHFATKQKKRKDVLKEKRPIAVPDCVDRILNRLGKCRVDFEHGAIAEPEEAEREKRVCGTWESEKKSLRGNGPKIVRRRRFNK